MLVGTYNVLDDNGVVVNRIVWDGVTPCGIDPRYLMYIPPEPDEPVEGETDGTEEEIR